MIWRKLGNIFSPAHLPAGMISHAAVPVAEVLGPHIVRIYFSARDRRSRSHVLFMETDIRRPAEILRVSQGPVLSPGRLGCFDDSGAMGSCLIREDSQTYLYYVGWNLGCTVPFRNAIGLAVRDEKKGEFRRCYEGPVMDRSKDEPHFVASCHVLRENAIYKMWYVSCLDWQIKEGRPFHRYHVKYARSGDGIEWQRDATVALDFRDAYEYAISVPRVIKDGECYRMWFSSRASRTAETYRIGYAESADGIRFRRQAPEAGIDVSASGWDSEMICYPFVFDLDGRRYMLYNGNAYGKTGFGLAVLEQEK